MTQRLLTFREAAVELKWVDAQPTDEEREAAEDAAGRRLRWAVQTREHETGKRIATRLGHRVERGDAQMRVTMGAIYRHFPEFRRLKSDEVAENFKRYIKEIDETIAEKAAEEIDRLVQPQIEEIHDAADAAQETADFARAEAAKANQKLRELEARIAKWVTAKEPKATRADG